jgi:hypothetical protein
MKSAILFFLGLAMTLSLASTTEVRGEEATGLTVEGAVICRDVADRMPVQTGTRFKASVGRLFCFTRITGAQEPTIITHEWYFDGAKWASISLRIGSASWRTFSSKAIQPHQVGLWHVDIVGPDGESLHRLEFEIIP